jgi:DNA adenine methylase Dam
MKPVVKWVGGKTQLLDKIKEKLPTEYNTYYEPFLGGAAVLLDLNPTKAVVNDINHELVNMYLQVRDHVEEVIFSLSNLDVAHAMMDAKEFFYEVREDYNTNLLTNTVDQAARFIYLNKHCFNGLYRVNSKGKFNVPFNGKLKGGSFEPDHLREVSARLKGVDIRCGTFIDAVAEAGAGDLVFFDSPYDSGTTTFTDYTKEGFGYEDHVQLASLFKELTKRGVYCVLTNHDTDLIRELYKDYTIEVVDVRRSINRKGNSRTGTEVIVTNY